MKKLFVCFTLTFVLCAGGVCAQSAQQLLNQLNRAPVKTVKPKGEMRIFVKDGEEVITNFPSENLLAAPKIHIVLPTENTQSRYPSVYIISGEELDKEKIKEMYPDFYGKYYFVTVKLEEGENNFSTFLTKDLLPYMELNYAVLADGAQRTLIAKNSFALAYLADLKNISAYLKNAALGFEYSSPLPKIEVTGNDLNLWADGPVDNIAALHASLAAQGLVYLENFAYNITSGKLAQGSANIDFLFNRAGRKISKITPYQQFETLDLDKDYSSLFWLNLKAKSGYKLAYIPQDLRIAPPLLNWNKEQATFNIILGASEDKVKVSGKTEFGKKFKAKFNIISSVEQARKEAQKQAKKKAKIAKKQ
ncbi:MAG: hypothetical protein J5594_00545 [Elusimicrobiaceae bacterium]|nr:hypothetical protein [Elusimicrobiaceae bacterium]